MQTTPHVNAKESHSNSDPKVPFLNLKGLYQKHRAEFQNAIHRVLEEAAYVGGNDVRSFEENFARWIGPETHSVACGNGTEALTLAARALPIEAGDEAILPAMTFVATAEALIHAGLKIKLVDILPDTWLMNCQELNKSITPKVRVIVPVHLYGQMAEMDRIQEIAKQNNCSVIEDAAQAHGSRWKGNPVGFYSDIASFSFYPGKNLGAFGDGGAIISRDEKKLLHCRALANHGGLEKFDHRYVGYNSRLDNLQAAVLNIKLKYIDGWNETRRRIATQYIDKLSQLPGLTLPTPHPMAKHTFHLFVVQVEKRADFIEYLKKHGVDSGIHYPTALHQIPALRSYFEGQQFPNAEHLAKTAVSLPMCPTLSPRMVDKVIHTVRRYFGRYF